MATAKQIAARKRFAEMARSGAFKRKGGASRKKAASPKRKSAKAPSPAQLAARKKFVAMVRARATAKKKNSRGLSSKAPAWTRSKKARRNALPPTDTTPSKVPRGKGSTSTEVRSPTSTEVKSPTRTATSTEAQTSGNVTVTGGAGAGATTRVDIHTAAPSRTKATVGRKKVNPAKRTIVVVIHPPGEKKQRRNSKAGEARHRASSFYVPPTKGRKKAASKRGRFGKSPGIFGGSGLLGLGRSRKTVRVNKRKRSPEQKRVAIKRQLRMKGVSIPKGSMFSLGKLRGLRKRNPSPASVFSEFRGKDVRGSSKSTGHGSGKLTVAQLGHLRELKLVGKKLEFGGNALLCADGRKRLHIGGVRFKASGAEEDMGEVRSVTYRADKPHIETGVLDYVHKFGEDGGKCPKLIVDAEGYPYFEGGSYKIDADGIIN